jgi:hypothetical protein
LRIFVVVEACPFFKRSVGKAGHFLFFDFNILTALKGWVGRAPQGRGALHI